MDAQADQIRQAVAAGMPAAVADLGRLVRIPSVSWPAFDAAHVDASAQAVAELMRGLGVFETVTVDSAPEDDGGGEGRPAVLAVRPPRNGRPRILLYAHHDVQPPGDPDAWETEPFEPTVRGDRLYARGAADDKAGILTHVAAIRALTAVVGDDPDLGIGVFIEGEEENGSRSFAAFLEKHRAELDADVIIIADSENQSVDTPALTTSLRGNVTFRLTVRTLDHPLHSGMFGGAVPDAMLAAAQLLASLHDADGSVAVEGLTGSEAPTPDYDEDRLRAESGLLPGTAPIGRGSILSRLWTQPAITVTGLDAPDLANASNTLLAGVSARVSVRVAPGQSAAAALDAVRRHVHAHTPFGADVEIADIDLGEPFRTGRHAPAAETMWQAMAEGWETDPVEAGVGGSIPFVADLTRTFPEAQILITGVEDPDTRAHSPNESLHLGVFRRAILTEALFLARCETAPPGGRIEGESEERT